MNCCLAGWLSEFVSRQFYSCFFNLCLLAIYILVNLNNQTFSWVLGTMSSKTLLLRIFKDPPKTLQLVTWDMSQLQHLTLLTQWMKKVTFWTFCNEKAITLSIMKYMASLINPLLSQWSSTELYHIWKIKRNIQKW